MRIVNNKIYIARGETPTYEASVIDKETGCPFMLLEENYNDGTSKGLHNPIIEFIVRSSVYDDLSNHAFKIYLPYNKETRFKLVNIENYAELENSGENKHELIWDDLVAPPIEHQAFDDGNKVVNAVMYGLTKDGVTEYRYYSKDEEKWVPYEFIISFPFPYTATAEMEPKTYKYEITLFDGTLVEKDGEFYLKNINFKKPLLEVTDFIVGGSVSE